MGLAESRLPSRDQTVLCFGEDVVPALEKLRLVDRLGEAITHHVVSAGQEDLDAVVQAHLAREVEPSVEVQCALGRARVLDHITRRLVVGTFVR